VKTILAVKNLSSSSLERKLQEICLVQLLQQLVPNFYILNVSAEFCALLRAACLSGSMPGWFVWTVNESL
jgi:hypothetical protein